MAFPRKRHINVCMQLFSVNLEQALVLYSESKRHWGREKGREKSFLTVYISLVLYVFV